MTAINRLIQQTAYYHRSPVVNAMPKIFAIELNNVCNLSCKFCPYKIMTRKKEFMSFKLFRKIISEAKGTTNFIFLHNYGEPLLHPQLVKFINYADSQGIKTGISTNCTLLDRNMANKILNSKLYLIILCLDGTDKKTYETLRKGGNYEKVVANIKYFLHQHEKLKERKRVTLQIVQSNDTKNDIKKFINSWKKEFPNIDIGSKPFDTFGGTIKPDSNYTIAGTLKHKQRYPCRWLWMQVVILANGDVSLCCRDYDGKIIVGNVMKNSIKDIWNSPEMKQYRIRQKLGFFDNGLCDNCPEWIGGKEDMLYPFSMQFINDIKKFKVGVD
jgi:radical SAM protein with 4Fe4S-binding SPASM domain